MMVKDLVVVVWRPKCFKFLLLTNTLFAQPIQLHITELKFPERPLFLFNFAVSGLPPRIQLSLAIPSTSTVGARNFLLLKTFAQKLVQEFSVSPSGTRVAMVTYSSTPRLVFHWNQYMNMKCTLKAISSLR